MAGFLRRHLAAHADRDIRRTAELLDEKLLALVRESKVIEAGKAALLLAALRLLLAPVPARAAISFVTSCNGTSSCTAGNTTGDLEIAYAGRNASTTAPSTPANWTSINTASINGSGSNDSAVKALCKVTTSNSEASGTFTNADNVIILVYRGQLGGDTSTCASTILGTPSFNTSVTAGTTETFNTVSNAASTSWDAGFGYCSACTAGFGTAPSGMTNRASRGSAPAMGGHDTNAGVSSFSTANVTLTGSGRIITMVIEIKAPNALSRTASDGIGGPVPSELASRVEGFVRGPADAIPAPGDKVSQLYGAVRTPADTAPPQSWPLRQAAYTRSCSAGGGGAGGWQYYKPLVIDHTKVSASDQTGFPVLICDTDARLKTVANGGAVQDAQGDDIALYSDPGLTTLLNFELERWNGSTGEWCGFVKDDLSHTADTTIYRAYGNSSQTSSLANSTGVWDSHFKGVWHLGDGTTLSAADSTGVNNGTLVNSPTATAGQIDGAAALAKASDQYINAGNDASLQITGDLTVSAWINLASLPASNAEYQVVAKDKDSGGRAYVLDINTSATYCGTVTCARFYINGGSGSDVVSSTTQLFGSTLYFLAGTYDSGAQTLKTYLDGSNDATRTGTSASISSATANVLIGRREYSGFTEPFDGVIDEVRISDSVRSADWIATEYNNQSDPGSFYSVGGETALGGGGGDCTMQPDSLFALADSAVRVRGVLRSAADEVRAQELGERGLSLNRGPSDAVPFSETVSRLTALSRDSNDALAAGESSVRSFGAARTANDAASLNEVAVRQLSLLRNPFDQGNAADAVQRVLALLRNGADAWEADDSGARAFVGARDASDAVVPSEISDRQINANRQEYDAASADAAPVSDVAARRYDASRSGVDTAPGAEGTARAFSGSRGISDGFIASDIAARIVDALRSAADRSGAAESAQRSANMARDGSDATPSIESPLRILGASRAAADAGGTFEIADRLLADFRSASDAARGADSVDRRVNNERQEFDAAGFDVAPAADIADRRVDFFRGAVDAIDLPRDFSTGLFAYWNPIIAAGHAASMPSRSLAAAMTERAADAEMPARGFDGSMPVRGRAAEMPERSLVLP